MSTCKHVMKQGKRLGEVCGGKVTALCKEKSYCCKHRKTDGKPAQTKVAKPPVNPKNTVALDLSNSLSTENLEQIQEPESEEGGEIEESEEVEGGELEPVDENEEPEEEHEYKPNYNDRVKILNEKKRQEGLKAGDKIEHKSHDDDEDDEEGDDLEDFKKLLDEIIAKLGQMYAMRGDVTVLRKAIRELTGQLKTISQSLSD